MNKSGYKNLKTSMNRYIWQTTVITKQNYPSSTSNFIIDLVN